ncbi:hypothetical protein QBC35DRAFT_507233 [Podospora australis]|uniref:TMEM205-like domain-containing protein n=1 Tax=Podospora australis TaxID=1536484 RepID=A0AAN6WKP8_9PEZI|nr:hypothetical protein QBC35DRAFT_507233 [Podospora australis]
MISFEPFTMQVLAPIHLLVYSSLLGTSLYQTFAMTKISYQALPKTAFRSLQKKVFPFYFRVQTFLIFGSLVTLPSSTWSPIAAFSHTINWIPHAVAGVTAVLNLLVYEPRTRTFMIEVAHQETRDASRTPNSKEPSGEMQQFRRHFSRAHAMSIHLNLITIGSILFYGWTLGNRISFGAM